MNSKTILMGVGTLVVLVIVVLIIFAGESNKNAGSTEPDSDTSISDNSNNTTNEQLEGTKWTLAVFQKEGENIVITDGAEVTLEFQEDGSFGGRAACNNYFGSFAIEEQGIVVSPIGSTQMACEEPLMNLEFEYLQVLQTVGSANIVDGGELVLRSSTLDNTSLTYNSVQ